MLRRHVRFIEQHGKKGNVLVHRTNTFKQDREIKGGGEQLVSTGAARI